MRNDRKPCLESLHSDNVSAASYAWRISSYISDPQTVRVRTLEMYGRAPSVAEIAEMRRKHERLNRPPKGPRLEMVRSALVTTFKCGHPRSEENSLLTESGTVRCRICRREQQAASAARLRLRKAEETPGCEAVNVHDGFPLVSELIAAATRVTGMTREQIIGQSRTKALIRIRFAIVHIAGIGGRGMAEIGRGMGFRDHSTIANARDRAADLMTRDEGFSGLVRAIRGELAA